MAGLQDQVVQHEKGDVAGKVVGEKEKYSGNS
jgi:hypothetical protein